MKRRLIRIMIGLLLFAAGVVIRTDLVWLTRGLLIAAYLAAGGDVLYKAARHLILSRSFDENLLMSVATIGAFGVGEFPEAVSVMLFYQVGELFQAYAVNRSRRSIAALMDIRPDHANLLRGGEITEVDPEEVPVGGEIVIRAGERVPLDGVVLEGSSRIDTSAITGEPMPRPVEPGDELLSGCINESGTLTVRVTKEFGESTVSRILDLVENAGSKKSSSENFISRFAAVYTPVVVIAAVLLAVIPPLTVPGARFADWIYRALTFLVVSCPCALVISIPLSFFGGIGGASRYGILVKGGNYLEALAKTEIAVFDKTGTLTEGVFAVREVCSEAVEAEELLALAAAAERYSTHPIAESLRRADRRQIEEVSEVEEIPGRGVRAFVAGRRVLAGNERLMAESGLSCTRSDGLGTIVHVAVDGAYAGHIVIADRIKRDAKEAVADLKAARVRRTVMLTGDRRQAAETVARELAIDEVRAELLPDQKVTAVEGLLAERSPKGRLVFVGDGLNDAPVLARADIGVAMGGLGSDAAIEAADVVIMTDEPSKVAAAMRIARRTLAIARQNIVFALAVKLMVLALGAIGVATMWEAVFADVGVCVIAVLNALRALKAE